MPYKGSDAVIAYRLDAKRGAGRGRARGCPARRRAAPYRLPSRKALAYVINELDSTLTTYRQDRRSGGLTPLQTCPLRRLNSLATARVRRSRSIMPATMSMSPIAVTTASACSPSIPPKAHCPQTNGCPRNAGTPRFFAFDPAERFLYVANQDSRSIVGYRAGRDGRLTPTRLRVRVGSPACIVFSPG